MLHGPGVYTLYNHSYRSNCEYEMDYEQELITVRRSVLLQPEKSSISITTGTGIMRPLVWFDTKPEWQERPDRLIK